MLVNSKVILLSILFSLKLAGMNSDKETFSCGRCVTEEDYHLSKLKVMPSLKYFLKNNN